MKACYNTIIPERKFRGLENHDGKRIHEDEYDDVHVRYGHGHVLSCRKLQIAFRQRNGITNIGNRI